MFREVMLAAPIDEVPTGEQYLMEAKYDGWRAAHDLSERVGCEAAAGGRDEPARGRMVSNPLVRVRLPGHVPIEP